MAFQKRVNVWLAQGVSGQWVSKDGFVPTPVVFMSDGTVDVGTFAFSDGTKHAYASKKTTGGKFLGFVVRTLTTAVNVPLVEHTTTYPKNSVLTIAQRGQFYYELPSGASDVKHGNNVLVDPTNGNVTFGDAGTANDTGWTVWLLDGAESAKAGDLVIVQNIGLNNQPSA